MLLLQLNIYFFLLAVLTLALFLLYQLLIEFLSHETTTFLLSQHGLLLLLVVEQLVELLDRGPLVFFSDLTVHFSQWGCLRRGHRHIISHFAALGSLRHSRAADGLGVEGRFALA